MDSVLSVQIKNISLLFQVSTWTFELNKLWGSLVKVCVRIEK